MSGVGVFARTGGVRLPYLARVDASPVRSSVIAGRGVRLRLRPGNTRCVATAAWLLHDNAADDTDDTAHAAHPLGAVLGARMGAYWPILGSSWDNFSDILGPCCNDDSSNWKSWKTASNKFPLMMLPIMLLMLLTLVGCLGRVLGAYWPILGQSLDLFGSILGPFCSVASSD